MRSVALGCAIALLCVQPATMIGQQPYPRTDDQRKWNEPFEPFRIIGNVYYVGTADLASYLIATPDGHILVDSGLEESATQLLASIAKAGFDARDIKFILNTQAHFDHAAGLAAVKGVSRAAMVASAEDRIVLEAGGKDDFAFDDRLTFAPVKVDRVVADGETVTVGPATLTAHLTPGHTKGTTTWTLVVREAGKDYRVVIAGSTGVNVDKVRGNPTYPTMVEDFEKTFATLRALPVDVFLSQHAAAYGLFDKVARLRKGDTPNPFIDPDGYKRWLENGEKAFRKLAQQ